MEMFENNYFTILNLLLIILNLIFSFAICWKLNSLDKNLYETFKFNWFLQWKKRWNPENFYTLDNEWNENNNNS